MFQSLFKSTVYIKISSSTLVAKHIESGRTIEDKPIVAVKNNSKGKATVAAIGSQAEKLKNESSITVRNSFNHPRVCIDDFEIAQVTINHFIFKVVNKRSLFKPIVILHTTRLLEGGLSQIENRALRELGEAAGARQVFIWTGRDLNDKELINLDFNENQNN